MRAMGRMAPLGPVPVSAGLLADLRRVAGAEAVSVDLADRLAVARDAGAEGFLSDRAGGRPSLPSVVVSPREAEAVPSVLEIAHRAGLPVVPVGAGSGTSAGSSAVEGGLSLSSARLQRVRALDAAGLEVEVEAGVPLARLLDRLERRGLDLGFRPTAPWPESLGGALARGSAGYAPAPSWALEDRAAWVELATSEGLHRLIHGPRPVGGPDWVRLLAGSEGTLGFVTAARLRLRPLPLTRRLSTFRFRDFGDGLEGARRIAQADLRPTVVRLYEAPDEADGLGPPSDEAWGSGSAPSRPPGWPTARWRRAAWQSLPGRVRSLLDPHRRAALLVVGFEGAAETTDADLRATAGLLRRVGAEDLGPRGAEAWWRRRPWRAVRGATRALGRLASTDLDVAVSWDRVEPLVRGVTLALEGSARVRARVGFPDPAGVSVALEICTPSGPMGSAAGLEAHQRAVERALVAVQEGGGSVAHHGGVGRARAAALPRELGPGGLRLQAAVRAAAEPRGPLNPGKQGAARFEPVGRRRGSDRTGGLDDVALRTLVGERNLLRRAGRRVARPTDPRSLAALARVAYVRGVELSTEQNGPLRSPDALEVDLGRLDGVPRISERARFVQCEAGVGVDDLERVLSGHRLSLGRLHPDAQGRTVGAAAARGTLIPRAGDRGALCLAIEALLPHGERVSSRVVPRTRAGPPLVAAFLGAHGACGLLTALTLRVQRPREEPSIAVRSFVFDHLEAGSLACAEALRGGLSPSAARMWRSEERAVGVFELSGVDPRHLEARLAHLDAVAVRHGGRARPAATGEASAGSFDEVLEVEVPWPRIPQASRALENLTFGQTWLDFMHPDGATVVVPARDPATKRAGLEWATGQGLRVVGPPELATSSAPELGRRLSALLAGEEPTAGSLGSGTGTG